MGSGRVANTEYPEPDVHQHADRETLDQLGNWEEFDQDDDGDTTWDLEQSRTHNDVNEVTAVGLQSMGAGSNWADPAFDAAGNMTTIPQPGTLTSSYTGKYDAWNRLVSLDSGSTATYEYDGLNRRIKRVEGSTTRHFYYNSSWQVLEERSTESGSAVKQFVWGATYVDELVMRDRDADANSGNGLEERLYALQDALYNETALSNTSGSVQERFSYEPYGESTVLDADMTVDGSGTDYAWEHRYTGRRLDPASGLQLNRNRYYHQQLGRWCTRDPVGYQDGQNLYRAYFVPDDVDPSGMERNSTCQAMQFRQDCMSCCQNVPGAGGRRGCQNGCNRKPPRTPVTGICARLSTAGSCGGCTSAACENDLGRIIDAIDRVPWTVYWGWNTCGRWALSYPFVSGEMFQSPCFTVEVKHWVPHWPEGFPFWGHAGIKVTACNGEVFFLDNWWLGGPDQIFGPDEVPDFYE